MTAENSRQVCLVAVAIGILLILSAVSPAVRTQPPNNTFIIGYGGTPFDTFNPFTTYTVVSTMSTLDVYDYLIRFNSTFSPVVPDLAYKWEVFPNNSAAEFWLVRNATWSDGVPVTAQDVVYSFEVANNTASRLEPQVSIITSIEAPNNYTVIFHYHPTILFLAYTAAAVPIVPEHVWVKYVPNPSNSTALTDYQDYPLVGSGPFEVTNYVQGQYIELTANPNYFYVSMRPHVQHIIVQFFKDTNSMVAALEAGQIDAVAPTILPSQVKTLEGYPNIRVTVNPGEEFWYIAVNVYPQGHGNPTLKDIRVRQALAHAINYTELAQVVWQGYATPMGGLLPPGNKFYDPNLTPYQFNLTLANQILNNAGYKMGSNGVRVSPNGTQLSYTLYVINEAPEEITAANIIASWWSEIGVKATVEAVDAGTLASIIWPNFTQDFDLWDWFTTPALPTLLDVFLSNQTETGTSDSGYDNPAYNTLYNQMISATNYTTVYKDAFELQQMLYQDLPYINLYSVKSIEAYNSQLFTGYFDNMTGGPFSDVNWYTFIDLQPVTQSTSTSTQQSSSASTSTQQSTSTTQPSTSSTSSQSTSTSVSSGISTPLVVGIAVVVVIVIAVAVLLLTRRRSAT
ncbi:MAG: peptide ABC transporter substrate-binding protein [Thermoprotei archaeon]